MADSTAPSSNEVRGNGSSDPSHESRSQGSTSGRSNSPISVVDGPDSGLNGSHKLC